MTDKELEVFSAEDFDPHWKNRPPDQRIYKTPRDCVYIANAKISKLMGPKVYGYIIGESCGFGNLDRRIDPKQDTHTAYLFSIQPIEKKECEHEYDCLSFKEEKIGGPITTVCVKCGAKLKAKWEVAE